MASDDEFFERLYPPENDAWFVDSFALLQSADRGRVLRLSSHAAFAAVLAPTWEVLVHREPGLVIEVPPAPPGVSPALDSLEAAATAMRTLSRNVLVMRHRHERVYAVMTRMSAFALTEAGVVFGWENLDLNMRYEWISHALTSCTSVAPNLLDLLGSEVATADTTNQTRDAILAVPGREGDMVRVMEALKVTAEK